jgi:dephospho-CoA kinase
MIKLAITGNIAVGKTTISNIFKSLGVPIFNSDSSARDAERFAGIQSEFKRILGDDIFVNGKLDRPRMRSIIFNDKEKLKEINSVVIPYVTEDFEDFCNTNKDQPYIILESAILFETDSDKRFDFIITVTADDDIKIERAIERDNVSKDVVIDKLNNQYSDEYKLQHSNFEIKNNGEFVDLEEQVLDIHIQLCRLVLIRNRHNY